MWTKIIALEKGGHRLFTNEMGRVAVADNSGRTPDQTDDGVLWLDTERMLAEGLTMELVGHPSFSVPLMRPDGSRVRTSTGLTGGHCLRDLFPGTVLRIRDSHGSESVLA